jgi:hypothetical protein
MKHVGRGQRLLDAFGIRPTYVVNYAVASQPSGRDPLREILADGRCEVGSHVHPWNTPPLVEPVTALNSYICNLPPALQRDKLRVLHETVGDAFGAPPIVFKAGRYGLGRQTLQILHELGYRVDASINPTMPPSADEGPDFRAFDSRPFRFGESRLIEVPCTHAYAGWSGPLRRPIHAVASSRLLRPLRAVGVAARLGLVNRIMLSPEASTLAEMMTLTRSLLRDGLRDFSLTFHSPSLDPGHTPYVRTTTDLDRFLATIRAYCEFFLGEVQGTPSTPLALHEAWLASQVTTT